MIGILLRNWQLFAIGMLLLTLAVSGVYVKTLKSDIVALKAEKASLAVKLEVSNASISALQKSIDEQNIAVQKLKSDSDAREKAGIAAVAKAKAEAAIAKKKSETIVVAKIPEGKTACDAADDLFNQEIKK